MTPTEQLLRDALEEVDGCFNAAIIEGLENAIEETPDEHLKDLLVRRLMYAHRAAIEALAAASQQAEQAKPIAWKYLAVTGDWRFTASEDWARSINGDTNVIPLYAAPLPAQPQGQEKDAIGRIDELCAICAEAYQVVGVLADEASKIACDVYYDDSKRLTYAFYRDDLPKLARALSRTAPVVPFNKQERIAQLKAEIAQHLAEDDAAAQGDGT